MLGHARERHVRVSGPQPHPLPIGCWATAASGETGARGEPLGVRAALARDRAGLSDEAGRQRRGQQREPDGSTQSGEPAAITIRTSAAIPP